MMSEELSTERGTDDADITHRFMFHPATTPEKVMAHGSVREACHDLAQKINAALVDGREKSLALTHLEETMFWANASIARNVAIEP